MKMSFGLEINQSQKMILTKELKQSLEILQMNRFEIEELIVRETNENPTLEVEKKDEIDWEKYLKNLRDSSYKIYSNFYETPEEEDSNNENYIKDNINMYDYLSQQLRLLTISPKTFAAGCYIIRTLNKDGYFKEDLESASRNVGVSLEIFEEGLKVVQSLEPSGIAARDISECLLLQIKDKGINDETLENLVLNDIEMIGAHKHKELCKKYNISKERLKEYSNVTYYHGNHDDIKEILEDLNIEKVDGILLDLGVSSYQIDEKTRGFTYMDDGPLDMRMDKSQKLTAEYIVNNYKEQDLARIIFEYGEEKFSRKIARNICEYRKNKKIETTGELVKIIEKSIPGKFREKNSHPAKRTFQAIRIEVNNEIEPLYNTIKNSITALNSKGRLCVITFHSLEDRMVKKAYVDAEGKCTCPKDLPYCVCGNVSLGKIITKKPILPTEKEMQENSRSRSAKLRVFEKI